MPFASRHQCLIYEGSPTSHLGDISRTLVQNLKTRRRCMYLNSPPMVAGMSCRLAADGINIQDQVRRGALVLSSDQSHLVNGRFDVDRMITLLRDAVANALGDGFAGLWAAGDMTWEFGNEENLDQLFEYERKLEALMQDTPHLSGICLYHRDTLPAHAIDTAMRTHPSLYLNSKLSEINACYVQHDAR